MTIDGEEDLAALRRIGKVVALARDAMLAEAKAGVSTLELDEVGRDVMKAHKARSAPKLAYKFPGFTCISVNEDLAHGIPSKKRLRDGDLVNIDVSAELDGYWADTGASTAVGDVSPRVEELLEVTKKAQLDAMSQARAGKPLNIVGQVVEKHAKRHGFRIIETLGGHGVGRFIHEDPHVPNHFIRREKKPLWEGLVLTIEPFLTMSATEVFELDDGWTLRTVDGCLGAQFEHTFVVMNGAPIVLT
ncbi:MAG: type I methionyl aminopeptidase [Sandaracinaceae bacterium]|nr:type I methionyl aminopeptidase [Sandaracinaceae bacterium]